MSVVTHRAAWGAPLHLGSPYVKKNRRRVKVVSSIREFEGMGVWKVVFWVSFK